MNFSVVLQTVLNGANYPQDKKEEFINTFNQYFFLSLLQEIKEIDELAYGKLAAAIRRGDQGGFEEAFKYIFENSDLKQRLDRVSESVINELVEDISVSATDVQKRKILDALPS